MAGTVAGVEKAKQTQIERFGVEGYKLRQAANGAKGGKKQVAKGLATKKLKSQNYFKYEVADNGAKTYIVCTICREPVKKGLLKHFAEVHPEHDTTKPVPKERQAEGPEPMHCGLCGDVLKRGEAIRHYQDKHKGQFGKRPLGEPDEQDSPARL